MNAFIEHHQPAIRFDYACFDRILLNGVIQVLQNPACVVGFLKEKRQADGEKLTSQFRMVWKVIGGPKLVEEHYFNPARKWRFDFAHLESRVAIELEGGIWSGGRHTRPPGGMGASDDGWHL